MTTAIERAELQRLYQRESADLLPCLPEVADQLHGAINDFARAPTPERAERLALQLDGARRHVLIVREALCREASGPTPDGRP